mmetsp:Transcript_24384/g.49723  ORF Transcript_24384/g.49723 Transcript_24384/m.49723 type:complete len:192 (-) Transcript_24384:47-622(-)
MERTRGIRSYDRDEVQRHGFASCGHGLPTTTKREAATHSVVDESKDTYCYFSRTNDDRCVFFRDTKKRDSVPLRIHGPSGAESSRSHRVAYRVASLDSGSNFRTKRADTDVGERRRLHPQRRSSQNKTLRHEVLQPLLECVPRIRFSHPVLPTTTIQAVILKEAYYIEVSGFLKSIATMIDNKLIKLGLIQ